MIGTGPSVAAALTAVLTELHGEPRTLGEIRQAYGGSLPAIARDIAGVGPGPLPRKGTPERRRYDAALRNLQRYYTSSSEKRRPRAASLEQLRGRARRRVSRAQIEKARRLGLGVRVLAEYRVSRNRYVGTLPADSGGAPRFAHVPGARLRTVLALFEAGDRNGAGDELTAEFLDAYWEPEEPMGALTVLQAWVRL